MAKTKKPKLRNTAVCNTTIKKKKKKPSINSATNEQPINGCSGMFSSKYNMVETKDLPTAITGDQIMVELEKFVDRNYISSIVFKSTSNLNKDCQIHVLNKGTLKRMKDQMISVRGKEYKLIIRRSKASLPEVKPSTVAVQVAENISKKARKMSTIETSLVLHEELKHDKTAEKTTVDPAIVSEVESSVVVPASEATISRTIDTEENSTVKTKESVVDNTNKEDDFETRRERKYKNLLFDYQPFISNPDIELYDVFLRKIATLEIEKEEALKRNTSLEMEIELQKKTINDLKVPIDASIIVDAIETRFELNKFPVCKICEYIHEDDDMCSKKVILPVQRPKPIYADDKSKWNRARRLYYLFKENDDAKVKFFVGRMAEVFDICKNNGDISGSYFENLFPNESFTEFKVSCSNSTLDEFLFLAAEVIADVYFLANLKVHTDI